MSDRNPFLPDSDDPICEDREPFPSIREAVYIEKIVDTLDPTSAAEAVGYPSPKSGLKALENPIVQSALRVALDNAGLTEDAIVRSLGRGLKAKRGVYHQGGLVSEEADHNVRHKYLTTLLELRGDLKQRTENVGESWEEVLVAIRARKSAS